MRPRAPLYGAMHMATAEPVLQQIPPKNALMRFAEWLTLSHFVVILCAMICL